MFANFSIFNTGFICSTVHKILTKRSLTLKLTINNNTQTKHSFFFFHKPYITRVDLQTHKQGLKACLVLKTIQHKKTLDIINLIALFKFHKYESQYRNKFYTLSSAKSRLVTHYNVRVVQLRLLILRLRTIYYKIVLFACDIYNNC